MHDDDEAATDASSSLHLVGGKRMSAASHCTYCRGEVGGVRRRGGRKSAGRPDILSTVLSTGLGGGVGWGGGDRGGQQTAGKCLGRGVSVSLMSFSAPQTNQRISFLYKNTFISPSQKSTAVAARL